MMTLENEQPKLLIIGAHPDDVEFHAGGLVTIYRSLNRTVKFISVTDGGAGHHLMASDQLAVRRKQEASNSAALIGAECETWDFPDGHLQVSLQLREKIIREIRQFQPDLVLTHRTCDYHPDHRAVSVAVQDASYMVTVPLVCPETPFLKIDPVVAYMVDLFKKPSPFQADVIIDISQQFETIVSMLACHESQVFEFLPFNHGVPQPVPTQTQQRLEWLRDWYAGMIAPRTKQFADQIKSIDGFNRESRFIEAYEISEYARPLTDELKAKLFPSP